MFSSRDANAETDRLLFLMLSDELLNVLAQLDQFERRYDVIPQTGSYFLY